MEKNQKTMALIALSIIALIIIFSVIFILINFEPEKVGRKIEPTKEIDNRISPYTNQGLIVEIKRIRNRELMEKMLTFGRDWKNKPTFYWICTVDGKTHDSSQIASAGGATGSGVFSEWDTLGMESKANFYIIDEQETSDITIQIIEQEKTGLFGRKTNNNEKETISLTYNYKTGRWDGDDHLKDSDGYGHVRGETYEIWFNLYQSDIDHDTIPYWTEVNILKTDPLTDDSLLDPDEDGIPTSWEWKWGYDPHTWDNHYQLDPDIDGIENIEEYQMREYYADPFQPDIYIEIDGMKKGGLFEFDFKDHTTYEETNQMIIERFAMHNMNVYIDDGWPDSPKNGGGELMEYMKVNDDTVGHHHNKFYQHFFPDERKEIFRYCTVATNAGFISPGDFNHYDHIVVDSGSRIVLKRLGFTEKYRRVLLAKGILHELGHSLGLMPTTFSGVDILPGDQENRWPTKLTEEEYDKTAEQYYSIMNYGYIFGPRLEQIRCFDYSDGSNGAPYDQNDWDHIYLAAFQTDQAAYEEAIPQIDVTFEDQEVIPLDYELEVIGWEYNENITEKNKDLLPTLTFVSNVDCSYRVYGNKEEKQAKNQNTSVRIYAKPNVEPTITVWTLIAEGHVTEDDIIIPQHLNYQIKK